MNKLDFSGCAGGVEGLGPGKRAVIWVRGCTLACPGCMTPELWGSGSPATFTPIEHVAAQLRPLLAAADGLTISGGEPMQQSAALKNLVQLLRREFVSLHVLVYSGYGIEELQKHGEETLAFLREIDILIDSRFDQNASNDLSWRGSDNQRLHLISERARNSGLGDEAWPESRPLQIQMTEPGQYRIIGIPRRGDMARYRQVMETRGLVVQKVKGGRCSYNADETLPSRPGD